MNEPLSVTTAEKQAAQVVSLIQECVQVLRSVDEFRPGTSTPLDTVDLYASFDKLLPKIEQCSDLKDETDFSEPFESRLGIVHHVLWPLATSLGQCYTLLDKVPPAPRLTKCRKPPPPPGLLSIQNYTDIAVLMEFLVCTSILPLLQRDILLSAQDRARHCLPKSLAGRIPRKSLLWGCAVQNAKSEMDVSEAILELRTTVCIISHVVTLDRFRPMLLPRHVVDLYAAMFQADALEKQWKSRKETRPRPMPFQYDTVSRLLLSSDETFAMLVDPFTQARAYQTLLSRGKKAPLWLRQQVSKLLTDLACRDIAAIVHVFVRSAGDSMTSASLRLARALTSVQTESNDEYYSALYRQLLTLLDLPENQSMVAPLDEIHQAGALTVWAVLDQLTLELTMQLLFPLITQDLVRVTKDDNSGTAADRNTVHKVVRRISTLLSSLTPSSNPWKVSRLLLSPIPSCDLTENGAKVTILGQLLRIAAIESVVMHSVKEDAMFALQCAVQTLVQSSYPGETQEVGVEIASLALVYSLLPTGLDAQWYRYVIPTGIGSETARLQAVTLEQEGPENVTLDVRSLVHGIGKMAKIVVENVMLPLTSGTNEAEVSETGIDIAKKETPRLPSAVFHLLLLCYFSSASSRPHSKTTKTQMRLPSIFQNNRVYAQLAVMILLPLICEKCSPETLLLTDGSGAGILNLMKLILTWARSMYSNPLEGNESFLDLEPQEATKTEDDPFHHSGSLLVEILAIGNGDAVAAEDEFDLATSEILISTSSIVLTLLEAMLELGSQKRSDEEERVLISMLPTLETFACFRDRDSRGDKESILFQPEMAEMAAHAMALIAARSQVTPSVSNNEAGDRPKREGLRVSIYKAEEDLQSDQPPIRARGVALLTRISRRYLQEKEVRRREQPLITIIEKPDQINGSDKDENLPSLILAEIVRVSATALGDTESYVFLAAIQSIVAAADVSPREVIPMIGHGICFGIMLFSRVGTDDECQAVEVCLSTEQRIKLTEALLFTIRRRGKAIYEFVPLLMNLFLYGRPESAGDDPSSGLAFQIQEKTHRYFVQGSDVLQNYGESVDRLNDHMDLRVRTGGPVFQTEENDVIRAACIAVLSELVSSTQPSVVARYCRLLMIFATNSLNLETSRPVRRATALLCCELYGALLLEQNEEASRERDDFVDLFHSVAIEMVSSDEEAMHAALRRCVEVSDVAESTTPPLISNGLRLYDPATAERCKEALDARAEVERCGAIAAAKLYVTSTQHDSSNSVVDLIRARLNEGGSDGSDAVTAMKRLKLHSENLGHQLA